MKRALSIIRSLKTRKMMSAINILSLAIGISSALVIFMVVYFEFSYDRVANNRERIYRVVLDANFNGTEGHSAAVMAPLARAVQQEMTGIEQTAPIMQFQGDAKAKVSIERNAGAEPVVILHQPGIVFTNPDYFHLFPFQWLQGSPASSLQNTFTVVLTRSRMEQYFPSVPPVDVVGRQITYNDDLTVTVSGVVDDLPGNHSFDAVEFISYATIAQTHLKDQFMMAVWNDWMAYSQLLVQLSANTDPSLVEGRLNGLLLKYDPRSNESPDNHLHLHLQPLKAVHFESLYGGFDQRLASLSTLYGLLAVAGFLLLLGCINFINLSTAIASHRAKEIGIRKTLGSSRRQLIIRFLLETLFITTIAAVLSFLLLPVWLRLFAEYLPPGLHFDPLHQTYLFVFLAAISVLITLAAGIYPAWMLSGYRPIAVLKNISIWRPGETRQAWIRKSLTVSQFAIAQFFILATLVVGKQIYYSLHGDMGFRSDAVLKFETPRERNADHTGQLLNLIRQIPQVELVSRGFLSPADEGAAFTNISYSGKKELQANIQIRWGDPHYLDVYGLQMIAGRKPSASDTMREMVINQTYAGLLGFPDPAKAVGILLDINGKHLPVVGVMNDFHDQSFRAPISPMVFTAQSGSFFHVLLKPGEQPGMWAAAINKMSDAYKQVYPNAEFNYEFVDDMISGFYTQEKRLGGLLNWASGLSILISCLGLFGLVTFTVNSRTKEIGIRKILGAGITDIVKILSGSLMKLVFIAYLIATPVAWWASNRWLGDYVYRTELSWWIFVLSGIVLAALAMITLGAKTVQAAMANPAGSLRSE